MISHAPTSFETFLGNGLGYALVAALLIGLILVLKWLFEGPHNDL
jgi:hypothetical protein